MDGPVIGKKDPIPLEELYYFPEFANPKVCVCLCRMGRGVKKVVRLLSSCCEVVFKRALSDESDESAYLI